MIKNIAPILSMILLWGFQVPSDDWIQEKLDNYTFHYHKQDERLKAEYQTLLNNGIKTVEGFFKITYPKSFNVYVHPNRQSWDTQLQRAYNMPDFRSECWMVASGDGFQLNMISPVTWKTEACEHLYADRDKTQKLITHELFHVFHGQHNSSPDFSEMEGLDWLAEGFATYASGQLDEYRKEEVKKLVAEDKTPASLDDYWKGKLRYGLSGSVVMFVDQHFGREILFRLLRFNTKHDVLEALRVSEEELLRYWRKYVMESY